ncbi:MAG TPA: MMPL family transporter, partial [bacterium]|nr:MMPL family transporter [bacterium]
AIRLAVEHLVLPCFLTSLTTAIGFGSLGVSRILPIRETGLLAAASVMLTFTIAITFAPAILVLLKPPKPQVVAKRQRDFIAKLLDACIRITRTHPKMVLLVSAACTVAALIGLPFLRVETNLIEYFKADSEVRQSYNFLEKNVSGANAFEFFIEGNGPDSVIEPAVLRAIEATQRELETIPFVTVTQSLADLVKMMNRAMHGGDEAFYRIPDTRQEIAQYLMLVSMGDDRGGLDAFTDLNYSYTRISARMTTVGSNSLRGMIEHIADFAGKTFPAGIAAAPTGASVLYVDMERELVHGQLNSFALAIVVIILCMALFFGSVRVGLYSIYPNVLPILMTLGLMGLVGIPINLATCMIPSIAIGIAVDDTIHFFSRFRREYDNRGRQNLPEVLAFCLSTTGRAMFITSAVLFCGFMVLLLSNFVPNLYFGVLTALTMVWALAADLLIVPAMLNVLRPKKF